MRFGRYLATMGATWALAAAAVIGFNLLVDPMGISPVRAAIGGFNEWKPLREQHDRIVKRFDVRRLQPATIFMGSSRIKQTIDPALLARTAFAPAYNGGVNGSADYGEMRSHLQYYLEADGNLRHVFVEAFATALLSHSVRREKRLGIVDDLADYASVFFSMNGLSYSVSTMSRNLWGKPDGSIRRRSDDGFVPIPLAPHHFSVRNIFNFVLHAGVLHRGRSLSPTIIGAAREMIEDCKARGVECRFFISPLHADALYAAYHLGLWPELERLKRGLAELGPTYDFTRYNELLDERTGPVVYWPEAFHFSPALGALVVKAMTGARPAGMPANFGVVLDSSNVESQLTAWREERDRWIAAHPDAVTRMQRGEENFRNGVTFKVVTDAEIAAGGW